MCQRSCFPLIINLIGNANVEETPEIKAVIMKIDKDGSRIVDLGTF